ncbi:uncharacterized protein [Diadema setosum]|uniref:uncharacterized protein isoform X2 n=1 Tax=Diadema setosum TaxID=31175 RepID=UPI003B3B8C08
MQLVCRMQALVRGTLIRRSFQRLRAEYEEVCHDVECREGSPKEMRRLPDWPLATPCRPHFQEDNKKCGSDVLQRLARKDWRKPVVPSSPSSPSSSSSLPSSAQPRPSPPSLASSSSSSAAASSVNSSSVSSPASPPVSPPPSPSPPPLSSAQVHEGPPSKTELLPSSSGTASPQLIGTGILDGQTKDVHSAGDRDEVTTSTSVVDPPLGSHQRDGEETVESQNAKSNDAGEDAAEQDTAPAVGMATVSKEMDREFEAEKSRGNTAIEFHETSYASGAGGHALDDTDLTLVSSLEMSAFTDTGGDLHAPQVEKEEVVTGARVEQRSRQEQSAGSPSQISNTMQMASSNTAVKDAHDDDVASWSDTILPVSGHPPVNSSPSHLHGNTAFAAVSIKPSVKEQVDVDAHSLNSGREMSMDNSQDASVALDTTSIWSSDQSLIDDDVEDAIPDSKKLQEMRSNVAMELLWIQQAIESRKNYLRLRHKIEHGDSAGDH